MIKVIRNLENQDIIDEVVIQAVLSKNNYHLHPDELSKKDKWNLGWN